MTYRKMLIVVFMSLIFSQRSFSDTATDRVWISKPDGTKQCVKKMGISLKKMKNELQRVHVNVFSQKKQNDGKMHIQVCGSPTGMLNTFEISIGDLEKVKVRGFQVFLESSK
jgi:hypothetical protein